MAVESANFPARQYFPQPKRAVLTRRAESSASRGESKAADFVLVSLESAIRPAGGHVAQDQLVAVGIDQALAVGREGDGPDSIERPGGLAAEFTKELAGLRIPD